MGNVNRHYGVNMKQLTEQEKRRRFIDRQNKSFCTLRIFFFLHLFDRTKKMGDNQTYHIPKISFVKTLCFLLILTSNEVQAQITYRKSIAFSTFSPLTIDPNQTIPQNNNQHYQHPSTPMGANVQDIVIQTNSRNQGPVYTPNMTSQQKQQANMRYIQQQMANDPMYQSPTLNNNFSQQSKQQKQIAEIKTLLNEDLPTIHNVEEVQRYQKTKHYRQAFSELLEMQNGKRPFSLKETVFIVENAYTNNILDYSDYSKRIKIKVDALNMLMKKEKISLSNNLGKNYIIQKLFSERIVEYKDTVVWRVHKPFKYDFDDFLGENDWSNMFVTKLLKTGKGQCHSMPLMYLILAEEINAKAWLSLAPEHSFVIFNDGRTFYNYETTNGNPVTYDWLMESGYINSMAIKNRIYLDTLGQDGLMSTLLADLIMGYTNKFGYDNFMASMVDTLLSINPKSIQGQIFKADLLVLETKNNLQKVGNPPVEQIPNYPDAHKSYSALMKQYDFIDGLGYMQMPKEKYTAWLASLNSEKHKQDNQKLKTAIIRNAKTSN